MSRRPFPHAQQGSLSLRPGFTLVELLVTITIISILASSVLVATYAAQESAREARTRALVAKLHKLLMVRWESYRTRRVPLDTATLSRQVNPGARNAQFIFAKRRLQALRELMRMEMPDRYRDILDEPSGERRGIEHRPALSRAYLRRYERVNALGTGVTPQFQGAECLYMILTMGAANESQGREQFRESEIDDVDGDGMPEFVDGWGRPISFLRWAPGFESELQTGQDPDPFDVRKVDFREGERGYALYPLIYSGGPDQSYGLSTDNDTGNFSYRENHNDPYSAVTQQGDLMGSPAADPQGELGTHLDNIHNHLLAVN